MNGKTKKFFLIGLLVYIGFFIWLGTVSVDRIVDRSEFREQNKLTQAFINLLRDNNTKDASGLIDKKEWGTQSEIILKQLAGLLNSGELIKIEAIEAEPFLNNSRDAIIASRIFYQIQFKNDQWAVAKVWHEKIDNQWIIKGFWLQSTPMPVQRVGDFTLRGTAPKHYVILITSFLVLLFWIYCMALCLGSNTSKKLLWLVFISVGVGTLGIEWASGQIRSQILWIGVPPFQAGRFTPYGQWLFTASFPIGALIYYFYKYTQEKINENGIKSLEDHQGNIDL